METSNLEQAPLESAELDNLFGDNSGNSVQEDSMQPNEVEEPEHIKAYRELQANYDKLQSELGNTKKHKELWEQFVTQPDIRKAIIAELEPDLYKTPDPKQFIPSKLSEEFGSDWEEKAENGSYLERTEIQERYRELKTELKKHGDKPQTFNEIKQSISAQKRAQEEIEKAQVNEALTMAKTTFKLNDTQAEQLFNEFSQKFAPNVTIKDIFYQFLTGKAAMKKSGNSMPTFENIPSTKINAIQNDLNAAFGNPPKNMLDYQR